MYDAPPPNYSPLGGNVDGGAAMLASVLLPILQMQMAKHGMVPAQFLPQQNMYDQLAARRFMEGQTLAMQHGAKRDAQTYQEFFRGAYTTLGLDPNSDRSKDQIKRMTGDLAGIAPFLAAFMPESFDAMHGRRGSALVMAQAMHRAGQQVIDPTTGRMGMRGETAGKMTQQIFDSLYGPGATVEAMKGISAGGAGALYEELVRRGMTDRSIGTMRTGGTPGAWGSTPAREEMLIAHDASKAAARIKSMAGAVSAMKDIFGESGNANAPMAQLMQALDQLTQGGLATMAPGKIEQMLRRTKYLAKSAGVTMEAVMGLTAGGAATADRLGVDRMFVPQMLQQTLAFGAGLNATGLLSDPAWGASNKEKLSLMHQQLGLSAAASPNINRINALLRMSDQDLIDTSTPQGKRLAALAAAARRGDSAALAGSEVTDDVAFRKLAEGAGMNGYVFQSILGARDANQEFGFKHNTGKLGLGMQYATDVTPAVRASFGNQVLGILNQNGVADAQKISDKVGDRVAKALRNDATIRLMADPKSRAKELGRIMKDATKAELMASGMGEATADRIAGEQAMRAAGEAGWGSFDAYQRRFGRGGIDTLRIYAPATMAAANRAEQDAMSDANMSAALAGMGSGGPMRNFIDAIREADPNTNAEEILLKVFGGTKMKFNGKTTSIAQAYVAANKMHASAARGADGRLTEDGVKQQERANAILKALTDGKISEEQVAELAAGDPLLGQAMRDAAKLGGFGGALREIGIDPNAAPEAFLSDAELSKVMPAEVVQEELTKLVGGGGTIKEAMASVVSGERSVIGARALRSRSALLKLARDKGLLKGEGVGAERAAIEALMGASDLSTEERDIVARNRDDYSVISDLGTESLDSAQEIRERFGAKLQDRAGQTKLTGTLTLLGLDKVLLAATSGGNVGDAALPPTPTT